MTNNFSAIDLEKLPPPKVIETLDFEGVFSSLKYDFQTRYPEYSAALESDPAIKLLEVAAYREVLLRGRVNDAAKAVMLATAVGADLENLAAFYGVVRAIVDHGDPEAIPPKPIIYETDTRLRKRTQMALEGFSTAGPEGAYIFHAYSASGQVKDVSVESPTPGRVIVTVLSTETDGTADADLQAEIFTAVNADRVRPLTDLVEVQGAEIIPYSINASLSLYDGPDAEVIRSRGLTRLQDYVAARHRLGDTVAISGIEAALHVEGVREVIITQPANSINCTSQQAAWCENINVE